MGCGTSSPARESTATAAAETHAAHNNPLSISAELPPTLTLAAADATGFSVIVPETGHAEEIRSAPATPTRPTTAREGDSGIRDNELEPESRPTSPSSAAASSPNGLPRIPASPAQQLRTFSPAAATTQPPSDAPWIPHNFPPASAGSLDASLSATLDDPVRQRAHRIFGPVLPADDAALYRAGFAPTEVYELRRPSRRRPRAPPGWTHRLVAAPDSRSISLSASRLSESPGAVTSNATATPAADLSASDRQPAARRRHRRRRFLLPEAAVSIEAQVASWEFFDSAFARATASHSSAAPFYADNSALLPMI